VYNATPAIVGKRIRCRSCGNVFLASDQDQDQTQDQDQADSQVNLETLAQLEESQSRPSGFTSGSVTNGPEVLGEQNVVTIGKLNTRYGFTGSKELDTLFPWLLVFVFGGWMTVELSRSNASGVG